MMFPNVSERFGCVFGMSSERLLQICLKLQSKKVMSRARRRSTKRAVEYEHEFVKRRAKEQDDQKPFEAEEEEEEEEEDLVEEFKKCSFKQNPSQHVELTALISCLTTKYDTDVILVEWNRLIDTCGI